MREIVLANEQQTDLLGHCLADELDQGDIVALNGPLGAGKTRLAQAICRGLEVHNHEVASPTFVLVREYRGRLPIYHLDFYRLRSADEVIDLGFDDMLDSGAVVLIEWADRYVQLLPPNRLEISLTAETADQRHATFTGHGTSADLAERLAHRWGLAG